MARKREAPAPRRELTESDLRGLTWRSVGPANMGGRVSDIAIAPGNARTFFVGLATGGLFKTTNNGTTFTPVFDRYETSSIGSVAVADAPPRWAGWGRVEAGLSPEEKRKPRAERGKGRIVWVGTGEGNGRNSSSWGRGVYRSTDGGETFEHVGLTETADIPRLVVDPRDPDVCYVAALGRLWGPNEQRGLYKTTDGGRTWQRLLYLDEDTGACDVILDPRRPDVVYAAMYMRRRTAYDFRSGGPQGGLYRSDNGGRKFKKLAGGLPAQTGRIGLDLYARDPRVVYAVVESDEGGTGADPFSNFSYAGGVFRSNDRGETWERLSGYNPRPFYFSKIRVDPRDDRRVYLLGWGLAISDDGGRNWRVGGARKPHVDMHALVINTADPQHLLMGTDGGLYLSYDRGLTWDFLNNLAIGQFYNVAVDNRDPYRIAGGLQDNGSWIGPSATIAETGKDALGVEGSGITNADWTFINNGDGFHVAFDPTDPNLVYAESQGGHLVRIHLDTGRRKTIRPSPKEGQPRVRFNWNAPFLLSRHDPTVLYLGGNCVFKLSERGQRWDRISDDLSRRELDRIVTTGSEAETHGTVVSLAESPLKRGTLWAGTDDGRIHVTTDDGRRWADVTPRQVAGLYVSKLEASHHHPRTAYAAIDGHRSDIDKPLLLMTQDFGKTWSDITGNLPVHWPAEVIREDLRNPDVLYAGAENACYVSIDRGGRWVRLNGKSLPTVSVDDLVQHPRELDLVAATHGRSVWILDDASPLGQLTPKVLEADLHLFEIPDARPRLFLPYAGVWGDRIFAAKNPPMGARISYWLRAFTPDELTIEIKSPAGQVIRTLHGPTRPGLNRVVWDLQYEAHDRYENDPDAELRQTQFVPAGQYTAVVRVGDHRRRRTFNVLVGAWESAGGPARRRGGR